MLSQTIILIGPTGAGKSTVGRQLSERLNIPLVVLDGIRYEYRQNFPDLDSDREQDLRKNNYEGLLTYWEPFTVYTVERALAENRETACLFDFGAIHTVYDDALLFDRVTTALLPYSLVVCLLPCPGVEECVSILFERGISPDMDVQGETAMMWRQIIHRFVSSPCNRQLAKITVYNKGMSADETTDAVINAITSASSLDSLQ